MNVERTKLSFSSFRTENRQKRKKEMKNLSGNPRRSLIPGCPQYSS